MGIRPTFVDIDRQTGNLDLNKLSSSLNIQASRGRPFCPVHFAGIPLDMAWLDSMLRHPDTIVIEDGAHALGSRTTRDNEWEAAHIVI